MATLTKKLSEYIGAIGRITKVNSTSMVENLNADLIGGILHTNVMAAKNSFSKIDDWNSITEPGAYLIATGTANFGTNAPDSYPYGVLFCLRGNNANRVVQIYFPEYHSNLQESKICPKYRMFQTDTWSDWVTFAINASTMNYVTINDLKEVLSEQQVLKLQSKINQRVNLQQSINTNDMNISNLQMGGGGSVILLSPSHVAFVTPKGKGGRHERGDQGTERCTERTCIKHGINHECFSNQLNRRVKENSAFHLDADLCDTGNRCQPSSEYGILQDCEQLYQPSSGIKCRWLRRTSIGSAGRFYKLFPNVLKLALQSKNLHSAITLSERMGKLVFVGIGRSIIATRKEVVA